MNKPLQFGLCMNGNEEAFTGRLRNAVIDCPPWDDFLYVEIGVAEGKTLASACQIIHDACQDFGRDAMSWRAIGIDIPDGWSLNQSAIRENNPFFSRLIRPGQQADLGSASLILEPAQQALAFRPWPWKIHFAFIDGCHGKPCAMGDFLALDHLMAPGGTIAFHDASVKCQGHHLQPHCRTGIDVRTALQELLLLPPDKRPGWSFLEEPTADHACAFFRKDIEG